MNWHRNPPPSRPHPPAYRRAFERLDAALAASTESHCHAARINLLGRAMFGDDWRGDESRETTDNPNPTYGS